MKTLKVTLQQHTPLIHFQPDQEGATLRASEVKPRLDRFIVEKSGGYEKVKQEHPDWFVDEHFALNYKMKIRIKKESDTSGESKKWPMFFADLGRDDECKIKGVESEECELIITTFHDELFKEIMSHIGTFFYRTNFGTRQTKGYGSFTITGATPAITTPIKAPTKLYFTTHGDVNRLLEEIEWIHKALRSGINDCFGKNRLYFKSLMFAYAKSKELQWDKKSIKQKFYPEILYGQQENHPHSDVLEYRQPSDGPLYDFRDCLGFSTIEQWKKPYHLTIQKSSQDKEIERFKSPITFKPVKKEDMKWHTYIIREEIPEKFKNKLIDVSDGKQGMQLQIPSDDVFNVKDYIYYVFKKSAAGEYQVKISSLFGEGKNTEKGRRIIEIFNELRENFNKSNKK